MSGSWSEVVHEHRIQAELQRAREEHRLRRRGYDVEEKATARIPAMLALAGALTAAAWWRKEGRKAASKRDWRTLPGVSQLLDFMQSGSSHPRRGPTTRSKSKPKTQLAPPSKAAAARQQAAARSGGTSAAAAAGAAALMRASGGGGSGGGSNTAAERQAGTPSTSYSSSRGTPSQQQQAAQSKAKKKKSKAKKK